MGGGLAVRSDRKQHTFPFVLYSVLEERLVELVFDLDEGFLDLVVEVNLLVPRNNKTPRAYESMNATTKAHFQVPEQFGGVYMLQ